MEFLEPQTYIKVTKTIRPLEHRGASISLLFTKLFHIIKMSGSASVQEATLDKFVTGWKNWKPEDMFAVWSEAFTQRELPFSLGHPPQSRAEVEGTLRNATNFITNFEVSKIKKIAVWRGNLYSAQLTVHEIVHDAPKGKAVVYAITKANTPVGDWANEYAAFITFSVSGEKITKIEEVVDSAFVKEFFPKLQKFLQERQSASSEVSN